MGLFDPKPATTSNWFLDLHAPAPKTVRRQDKIGPAPVRRQTAPDTRATWQRLASEPWPEQASRMKELMRRVRAGEDLETVKRELWADQYRGDAE